VKPQSDGIPEAYTLKEAISEGKGHSHFIRMCDSVLLYSRKPNLM
jgi:hypothetical protein